MLEPERGWVCACVVDIVRLELVEPESDELCDDVALVLLVLVRLLLWVTLDEDDAESDDVCVLLPNCVRLWLSEADTDWLLVIN